MCKMVSALFVISSVNRFVEGMINYSFIYFKFIFRKNLHAVAFKIWRLRLFFKWMDPSISKSDFHWPTMSIESCFNSLYLIKTASKLVENDTWHLLVEASKDLLRHQNTSYRLRTNDFQQLNSYWPDCVLLYYIMCSLFETSIYFN